MDIDENYICINEKKFPLKFKTVPSLRSFDDYTYKCEYGEAIIIVDMEMIKEYRKYWEKQ